MSTDLHKTVVAKFPLRLMPSVRKTAEALSAKEGVSLNQFINIAVAEKVAHLEYDAWLQNRRKPTKADIERALDLLEKGKDRAPDPGDELPKGYHSLVKRRVTRSQRAKAS